MKRKIFYIFFGFLITLSIALFALLNHSKPLLSGEIQLTGLSAPVRIVRDNYGIPHIYAKNKLDALRAQGYVIASDRLFQMEIHRRLFRGELSEVFGAAALASDKIYRSLMIIKSVQEMMAYQKQNKTFDEEIWQELTAYFDGVNEYAKNNPLPYEFSLVGLKPSTFSPEDAYAMTGFMAYSFGIAPRADVLLSKLSKEIPQDLLEDLRNEQLPNRVKPVKTAQVLAPILENSWATLFDGSNAWLISASKSASGKPLFANDPHIGYSAPGIWYEAHLKSEDGYEFYGHHIPLIPFAVIGHNRNHAWGFTMSLNDDMDLYQEKVDRASATYEFKGKKMILEVWNETIKVKNQPDQILKMERTHHGPLLNNTLEAKDLALSWAFHSVNNDTLKSLRKMAHSQSMTEFKDALNFATAPGLNVMYADDKNIAWWTFGELAIKANPHSDFVLDGASGKDETIRKLTLNERPHLENPAEGFIVTANAKPKGLLPNIRGDWQSNDRQLTIEALLGAKNSWSIDDLKQMQTQNYNVKTKNYVTLLLADLELSEIEKSSYADVLAALKTWNYHSDPSSVAASVYHQWNNEVLQLLLQDLNEEDRDIYSSLPYAWIFYSRVLEDQNSPWWKKYPRKELITEGFINAISTLTEMMGSNDEKWRWGKIHTLEFVHPLGRQAPLNMIFNVGPHAIGGAFNEINNNKAKSLGKDFKVIAGPSTRILIDFADVERSWGILPLGNSGHRFSPFFDDQRKMFFKGEYRPQLMNDSDIQAAKTYELILKN